MRRFECYNKYDLNCSQFYLSCSILIIDRGIVAPTLKVNPILLVIPRNFSREIQTYSVTIVDTYQVNFHPNFNRP